MPETKSAVLPLPRELRDCIYEYLLTRKFYVMDPRPQDVDSSLPLLWQPELAILIVSRSTCDEAERVLYKHGRFHFSALGTGDRTALPPLHQEIRRIPDLEELQDIIIHVDPSAGGHTEHDNAKDIEYGTALINYFAGLDSGVQRKRCVIQVDFVSGWDFLDLHLELQGGFKDAIGRLRGFKAVKLEISFCDECMGPRVLGPRDLLNTFCTTLYNMLESELGKGEQVHGRTDYSCVYHPQQV